MIGLIYRCLLCPFGRHRFELRDTFGCGAFKTYRCRHCRTEYTTWNGIPL